jgi:crotonobetainyl-CoA:carnitine CoA-transferase CaiB-like acyl-CoA transferase
MIPLPLEGVLVLDFTMLLPGPYCAQLLSDLGATVFKIEPLSGDPGRHAAQMSFWTATNRGKLSISIDLKTAAGQAVCRRLAARCDAAIESYRPGVAHRLGISAELLHEVNPRLIYCSLSGYGQFGPLRDKPGHDINYLASGGGLDYSGRWDEPATRSGIPVADVGGGSIAALAIVAALYQRKFGQTEGPTIDIALRDVVLSMTSTRAGAGLNLPAGERAHLLPTNDVFLTADGIQLALGLVEEHFWQRFVDALPAHSVHLRSDEYRDESGRRAHGDDLKRRIAEIIESETASYWLELLSGADVPAERVLTFSEAVDHPATVARDLVETIADARFVKFPALWDGAPFPVRADAPALGADARQVLVDTFGYTSDELAELVSSGVVGVAPEVAG